MKAVLQDHVIAEGTDVIEHGGYFYFPPTATCTEWAEKTPKTASDLECPHHVQFYDVIVDGKRYERVAWVYEAPKPALAHIAGRFGFWKDAKIQR